MRNRVVLLAIPPESGGQDGMSRMRLIRPRSIFFAGPGGNDYVCGRCGRLLAHGIDEGTIRNVWLICPKCDWVNGMDLDLSWALYVASELQKYHLSLGRIESLLGELRTFEGSVDEFLARNADVRGPLAWLARINVATLVAVLSLLVTIYSNRRTDELQHEQLEVSRSAQQAPVEQVMTEADLRRLAETLHALQRQTSVQPPPSPKRSRRARPRRKP